MADQPLADGHSSVVTVDGKERADALVRREFLESMVDRAAAGQTVFLSSHQIGEVERVADIVAIVRSGQLVLIQRLDELKAQVRELTVTLEDGAPPPMELSVEILSQRRKLRQWQLLVRGMEEDQLSGLRGHPAVQEVEVRAPNLEEIFVAYMRQGDQTTNGNAHKEVQVQ